MDREKVTADLDDVEEQILRLDPRHWAEARERVAALKAYLALPAPTQNDAESIAASAGISRARFYEIVRRWRDTGRVAVLVPHASAPATRSDRLPQQIVTIIHDATEELLGSDPAANADDVWKEVTRRCLAQRLAPPSRVTVRRRVAKHVVNLGGRTYFRDQCTPVGSAILFDRATIALPCLGPNSRLGLPTASLAVDERTGHILDHLVTFDQAFEISVAAMLLDLAARGGLSTSINCTPRTLKFDRGASRDWQALIDILRKSNCPLQATRSKHPGNGRKLKVLLPTRLGAIPISLQAVGDDSEERLRRYRGSNPRPIPHLRLADVERAFQNAVSAYNESLPHVPEAVDEPDLRSPQSLGLEASLRDFLAAREQSYS